ncbi:MAG: T9SS type A sorting domain-containing protein, partial [Candidatus Kapabacteria bacterium]|nr:T9SS type A sorting domain-containing protein [Candidatus Kapabacteria bacterium]
EGLVRFDGESCMLFDETNAPFKRLHPFQVTINSIAVDKNNNIWITAVGVPGLIKYDHQNWTVYDSTNTSLRANSYPIIVVDKKNHIWAGSTFGLYKFDGTTWEYFDITKIGVKDPILNVVVDKENNVWCSTGHSTGLIKFDGIEWTIFNQLNSPIHGNQVLRIYVDKKQNVWIQVTHIPESGEVWKQRGVNIYRKGGVILNVDENHSLISQKIVFPNPVNDILTIISEIDYNFYEVIDLKGFIILSDKFDFNKSIDVSSLNSGTYCLRLNNDFISKTVFFIKN